MKIGIIGTGVMGHGMALNLLSADHELTVVAHRNRDNIENIVRNGAIEAESLEDLARKNPTVLLSLPGTATVREVIGVLAAHLCIDATVVDTTTITSAGAVEFAAQLSSHGISYVEAPVTGGMEQARQGVLGAIVGCDDELFAKAREVLGCFCGRVEHFGPVGTGARAKLVSNYLAIGTATLVIDAFKRARALGVDWRKLYDLAQLGSGNSVGLRRIIGSAIDGDFGGYAFSISNAAKDCSYICDLLGETGGTALFAKEMKNIFDEAVAAGHGRRTIGELLDPDLK